MNFEQYKIQLDESIKKANQYKHKSVLSWDSGFAEQRNRPVNESLDEASLFDMVNAAVAKKKADAEAAEKEKAKPKTDAEFEAALNKHWDNVLKNERHDEINYRDQVFKHNNKVNPGLTLGNLKAIARYTGAPSVAKAVGFGSSKNINGYLRNKLRGSKKATTFIKHHDHTAVHKAVQELSAAFKPESTNKTEITTYSGIPHHIGEELMHSGEGSHHVLAGFTSTSKNPTTARSFAIPDKKPKEEQVGHMLKLTVKPGAGLDIGNHSAYREEEEVLLHHGAHITYHGTTKETVGGAPTLVHHVTVHATHTPLEKYGDYKEAE